MNWWFASLPTTNLI